MFVCLQADSTLGRKIIVIFCAVHRLGCSLEHISFAEKKKTDIGMTFLNTRDFDFL